MKNKTKSYTTTVNFFVNVHGFKSEQYDVEIPADTKKKDEVKALMDALRPILQKEYKDDYDWENGNIVWSLVEWDKI